EVTVVETGINGKMSEFTSAFGLLQLQYMDEVIGRRKEVDATYRRLLEPARGIRCLVNEAVRPNYSYFPILVESEYTLHRDALYHKLRDHDIFARRYFYPLISDFPMYRDIPSARRDNLPVAAAAAE